MFQRLLICTDFSDGLQRLANFAPSFAAGGVRQLVFLHTLSLSADREIPRLNEADIQAVRDRFALSQKQIPLEIEVKIKVRWGRPIDAILEVAKSYQSDLIILGTVSRNLLTEKLFGSTAIGLCQRTPIPLMILRPQVLFTYTNEELDLRCRHLFRSLLIPYDGSPTADRLIEQIKARAQNRFPDSLQSCLLCWVLPEERDVSRRSVPQSDRSNEAQTKLAALKKDLESLKLKVATLIERGNPVQEVLAAAQEYNISAIALSSGNVGKLIEISVPSFSGDVLRRSFHPVIYFPPVKG
jgi:nucleotide-binding universal stress UspA family protein